MTVAELIECLKEYPKEFEVRFQTKDSDFVFTRSEVYRANFRPIVYIGFDQDEEPT